MVNSQVDIVGLLGRHITSRKTPGKSRLQAALQALPERYGKAQSLGVSLFRLRRLERPQEGAARRHCIFPGVPIIGSCQQVIATVLEAFLSRLWQDLDWGFALSACGVVLRCWALDSFSLFLD
jgi:hypothetical protein